MCPIQTPVSTLQGILTFIKDIEGAEFSLVVRLYIKSANLIFDIQDWWLNQLANFYSTIKYDGIWIDMNEPANFVTGSVDGCQV